SDDRRGLHGAGEWTAIAVVDGPDGQQIARRLGLADAKPGQRQVVPAPLQPGRPGAGRFRGPVSAEGQERPHGAVLLSTSGRPPPSANRAATRAASTKPFASATPFPAMSYAVPWATLVRTIGMPTLMLTACGPPSNFSAICPWSWYIATTPSNSPRRAR